MAHALYNARWRRERAQFLRANPLCVEHRRHGRLVPASVVDHKVPHKGDLELFWDQRNWQALCKPCHDSWKQQAEHGVVRSGADATGNPVNPGHHWNQG